MTREDALMKVVKYLQNDFDLNENECRQSFEYKIVERIYDDFDKEKNN